MHSNQKCPWRWMIQERKAEFWWLCGEAAWLLCNIWNTLVMSGGRRLEVSLRREIELWQRPPVTAIRVLKFWRARSFYSGESRGDERGVWDGKSVSHKNKTKKPKQNSFLWRPIPFPVYLRHVNELSEDLGSLLGCVSAEDHQLDPLGDSVTHHDRPLQRGVVPHRASHHVAAVVQELANQISSGQSGNNLICVSI